MALDPQRVQTRVAFGDARAPRSFWDRVRRDDSGCWRWAGYHTEDGYGRFVWRRADGTSSSVHRWSHQTFIGPIPEGLQVDHVSEWGCTFRDCVNPAHLEAVTVRENVLRSDNPAGRNAAKTHCPQGHPYDGANTRPVAKEGKRRCRVCRAEQFRRAGQRRRQRRTEAAA